MDDPRPAGSLASSRLRLTRPVRPTGRHRLGTSPIGPYPKTLNRLTVQETVPQRAMSLGSTRPMFPVPLRRLLAFMLFAGLVAGSLAVPAGTLAYGGNGLRDAANSYRVDAGIAPVAGTALLDQIATERAATMVQNDTMVHDMTYVRSRLDGAGVCWTGYGEIIAYSWSSQPTDYSYTKTMLQWWNSPLHRSVLLDANYNVAGGAWARTAEGKAYSVMVFARLCGGDAPSAGYGPTPFTDIGSSPFRSDIAWLYTSGITSGCSPTSYCPDAAVTRQQMASFLSRALHLAATQRDYFTDDTGSVHEADINRLAAAGIGRGCSDGRFCPNVTLTRDQMAAFLTRALSLAKGGGLNQFDDDNGSVFETDINLLGYGGITTGCDTRMYCPDAPLTRGQMAAFLHRAFGG